MGKKALGRRGRRDEWDDGSPTWRRVMQASQSPTSGGGAGSSDGTTALCRWLMTVAGRATLMVLTSETHAARQAAESAPPASAPAAESAPPASAQTSAGRPSLRQAETHSEMLAAVKLCEDAFAKADVEMGDDWWRYGAEADRDETDVDAMPYTEATAHHAQLLAAAAEEPTRRYFLHTEPNSAAPTAAIIVEAYHPTVWVVALMGSKEQGHGRRALTELQRLALGGSETDSFRVLALEALDGATMKRKRLVDFYASCGFESCGNTPSHLNSEDSIEHRATQAELLYPEPANGGIIAIELDVATSCPEYAMSSCDEPEDTQSPPADGPDEPRPSGSESEMEEETEEVTRRLDFKEPLSTTKVSTLAETGRSPSLVFGCPEDPASLVL